ncbi:uncharacterized protein PITG_10643 [Phytophthora infestans T30-4]|uniref:CCHC-type domain-containing protein n=1 Tax=Phytophthora infestans (strain T30-4) TaxID=403677 RepID=D0NGR7_PHYIT|nr:uncharacterized protein PITG_10643 [Phytophthora infestans T30-4]EEY58556.1 conserved hypothetical protein [Phytophthora infestans T30-4]|eukprot:XP_002901500.1 conserved hypothetical protein [Phytophthora infestans T30-4]
MEHHGGGVQPEHFMAAFERIAAGLSQQNAQIYQDFQSYLQGYQQQLQQQLQAQHAHREHKIEGVSMPTYHGRPHESNGPRVVAMLAANFRDGAASWYHAKVMVEHQFRLRAELRQCQQRGSVDDYVDHFCEGLKSETKKEVMYLRCATLADAIAAAQAYERTHFSGERGRQPSSSRVAAASDGPTPMDLSVVDSRQIDKRTCRERNLCFYCKEVGHRIANCPRSNGQNRGRAQGNGVARQM